MTDRDIAHSESYPMEVLIYFSSETGTGAQLEKIMKKFTADVQLRVFRNWMIFVNKLMSPKINRVIVVIVISQREELLDAISIRDLIHEYRLILILPDEEEETISLGHSLRPNFMTYKMGNLHELEIVLKKMLHID